MSASTGNLVAMVAGGAGAVGEGIVRGFLAAGAHVVVPSRDEARLAALRDRLGQPERLVGLTGDVGTTEGAAEILARVLERYDGVDAVVASLGGWWQGPHLADMDLADWDRVLANNLRAHAVVARAFLPQLRTRPGSSYTILSGDAAEVPAVGSAVVSVAAAGQVMLARALAAEEPAVRVNALVLGVVATRKRADPRPEWITADEVGAFAAHLASDAGAMVSGSVIRLPGRPAR